MSDSQSIYATIGGQEAVEAVVSDFYDRVFDDPVLEPYFEGVDREALYAHQVQFISAVAGGPVSYDGADMRAAHEGMGVTEEAFGRVATYLAEALRERRRRGERRDDSRRSRRARTRRGRTVIGTPPIVDRRRFRPARTLKSPPRDMSPWTLSASCSSLRTPR